jgi:predicted DCC family thiol-disulfide oxidoreductase YuxK
MKQDKVIIYDDSCPLCTWYTGVFTRAGFLDKNGRTSFCAIEPELLNMIDKKRSRNEIPLINRESGEVLYGVDALLDVLGRKIAIIKTIGNLKAINWLTRKLYKLISYNRRVIVAGENKACAFDCTPDFNLRYRSAFIFLSLLFNTTLLIPLQEHVFANSVFSNTNPLQLQLAHFALVVSNLGIAIHLNKKTAFEYLGQVTMLALVAMLLTIPLIILNHWASWPVLNNITLALILAFTVKEYFRRMRFAGVMGENPLVVPLNIGCLAVFLVYLAL